MQHKQKYYSSMFVCSFVTSIVAGRVRRQQPRWADRTIFPLSIRILGKANSRTCTLQLTAVLVVKRVPSLSGAHPPTHPLCFRRCTAVRSRIACAAPGFARAPVSTRLPETLRSPSTRSPSRRQPATTPITPASLADWGAPAEMTPPISSAAVSGTATLRCNANGEGRGAWGVGGASVEIGRRVRVCVGEFVVLREIFMNPGIG